VRLARMRFNCTLAFCSTSLTIGAAACEITRTSYLGKTATGCLQETRANDCVLPGGWKRTQSPASGHGSNTCASGIATSLSPERMTPLVAANLPSPVTRHPRLFLGSMIQMLSSPNCK